MTIGERIRDRRLSLRMSADELAEILGKNRATVYRYESNDIENLPASIIVPLANALCCSPAYLMGWSDNENHQSGYTPQEQNLVANYRQLNTANQRKVDEYVTDLLRGGRNSKTVEKDIAAFGGAETVTVNAAKLDEVVEKLLKEKGLI